MTAHRVARRHPCQPHKLARCRYRTAVRHADHLPSNKAKMAPARLAFSSSPIQLASNARGQAPLQQLPVLPSDARCRLNRHRAR